MAGVQYTTLRIPDVITGAWFRQFVIEVLAKADIRNAIGYGVTISSDGNSVATLSTDAESAGAILGHNLDPLAHVEAFSVHVSQPDPHPAYAMHREDGLPMRQPKLLASAESGSGPSSPSGAPARHEVHAPSTERVLNRTSPAPRH